MVKIKMITKTNILTILVYFFNAEEKSSFFFSIVMSPMLTRPMFANEVKASVTEPNDDLHEQLTTYKLNFSLFVLLLCDTRMVLLLDYLGA